MQAISRANARTHKGKHKDEHKDKRVEVAPQLETGPQYNASVQLQLP